MKKSIHCEPFAIVHETCYPDGDLTITWSELRTAEVGKSWSVQDQDRYPNRSCTWTTRYEIVYRNEDGALVRKSEDGVTSELMWFDFNN